MKNLIRKILKEELNTKPNLNIGDKVTIIANIKIGPMRWDRYKVSYVGVTFQKDKVIDTDATYLGECDYEGILVLSQGHERCFEPDEINITKNTKLKESLNEAANATFVKDFLVDFGTLLSLNFSQITKMGKDENATNELKAMMERIRKPIINGQTYFEIIKDINAIPNNPKLLSAILSQVKNFIEYVEPRVERFVKDGPAPNGVDYKKGWLDRIKKIKEDYKKIVTP
jgi:hypothetical protein